MASIKKITPNLWFDDQAEEAAKFYVSIFKNSKIKKISKYSEAGFEIHKRPAGSVMTVKFSLGGQNFIALNGGPFFKFNEAVSFIVTCETQDEIDYYWKKLSEKGDKKSQQCGWLKDKYGMSWQVVPEIMEDLLEDSASGKAQRVMNALLKMKKLNIKNLKKAAKG